MGSEEFEKRLLELLHEYSHYVSVMYVDDTISSKMNLYDFMIWLKTK